MKKLARILTLLALAITFETHAQTNAPVLPAKPTPPPPPSPWTGLASLGLTLTRGNSDTTTGTADIKAARKTKEDELLMEVTGTYGKNAGVVNVENDEAKLQYNLLAPDRFYYGIKFDALNDVIADIHYRVTISPLAGYFLMKNPDTTWAVEVGPGVVMQQLDDESFHSAATLRLATRFEHHFTLTTKMWANAEIMPQVNEFKNYYADGEIGVDSALSTHFSLRTYFDDSWTSVPSPGKQRNDAKLVAALAYKF